MSRREGIDLRGGSKSPLTRRPFPPGVHGPKYMKRKPRLSGFGLQLREKQKAKRLYDVRERQFRNYFEKAVKRRGNTSDYLMELLETRFDNVVYRLGLAKTRRQARQMVSHRFFTVNGTVTNIPSFTVKIGDEIAMRENKQKKKGVEFMTTSLGKGTLPSWLSVDKGTLTGKVTSLPKPEDTEKLFDPGLIVEFYSR